MYFTVATENVPGTVHKRLGLAEVRASRRCGDSTA